MYTRFVVLMQYNSEHSKAFIDRYVNLRNRGLILIIISDLFIYFRAKPTLSDLFGPDSYSLYCLLCGLIVINAVIIYYRYISGPKYVSRLVDMCELDNDDQSIKLRTVGFNILSGLIKYPAQSVTSFTNDVHYSIRYDILTTHNFNEVLVLYVKGQEFYISDTFFTDYDTIKEGLTSCCKEAIAQV